MPRIDLNGQSRLLAPETTACVIRLADPVGQCERTHLVRVTWTPCGWGGVRPWLLCSACGRRARTLYIREAPACRRCAGLVYPSTREDATDRALRRANALRTRLGWPPGIVHGLGPCPRGMHSQTCLRLQLEYLVRTHEALDGLKDRVEQVVARTWPGARY